MARRKVDFNTVIGKVLRYGVITSFVVIGVGSVLLFAEGQTGYYQLTSAGQLIQRNASLTAPGVLIQGIASAKPYVIIDLGLLILFGTPVARVFVSIFLFIEEGRRAFVLITIMVFALLMFSIFVVAPLVSG